MTVENWKSDCQFSIKLAVLRVLCDFGSRLHWGRISEWSRKKKDQWILKYLHGLVMPIIKQYEDDTVLGEPQKNAPIWICWWTGEDSAPQLVKQCIRSIRQNAGEHPVHMITALNYTEYLEIPDYIMKKVQSKDVCLAHLSDYIRICLLKSYGGLWLDATIFCTNEIKEEYFQDSLFTCKSPYGPNGFFTKGRWTTFCIGGWKNHVIFRFLKDAFEFYWKIETKAIDYLLFDYFIEIAYINLPTVRKCLEGLEINNVHRDELQAAMNKGVSCDEFWNVIKEETILYKLSWRENYSTKTENNEDTVYQFFLDFESNNTI